MFIVNFEQIPNFELLFLFDIEHDDKQTIAGMIRYEWCNFSTENSQHFGTNTLFKTITQEKNFRSIFVSFTGSWDVTLERGLLTMEHKLSFY